MSRVAILQPTYWARTHVWNRVFNVDTFVWLDSVKFSRSSTKWEDRTVIESTDGRSIVLRLPLAGSRSVSWAEAGLNAGWQQHEVTIRQCYTPKRHWQVVEPLLEAVYRDDAATIDEVCWRSFEAVRSLLEPACKVVRSSDLDVSSAKGLLVLDLVREVGGNTYLSGAPGMSYLPLEEFARSGVAVEVQDWRAPTTSGGLTNPSILHLLAEHGTDACRDFVSRIASG